MTYLLLIPFWIHLWQFFCFLLFYIPIYFPIISFLPFLGTVPAFSHLRTVPLFLLFFSRAVPLSLLFFFSRTVPLFLLFFFQGPSPFFMSLKFLFSYSYAKFGRTVPIYNFTGADCHFTFAIYMISIKWCCFSHWYKCWWIYVVLLI